MLELQFRKGDAFLGVVCVDLGVPLESLTRRLVDSPFLGVNRLRIAASGGGGFSPASVVFLPLFAGAPVPDELGTLRTSVARALNKLPKESRTGLPQDFRKKITELALSTESAFFMPTAQSQDGLEGLLRIPRHVNTHSGVA
jgi:hypothetical protein